MFIRFQIQRQIITTTRKKLRHKGKSQTSERDKNTNITYHKHQQEAVNIFGGIITTTTTEGYYKIDEKGNRKKLQNNILNGLSTWDGVISVHK